METSLDLPIKRACEEIGSYSGLEASKKAKADTQSADYSSFRTFDDLRDHYGDSLEDRRNKWSESLHILKKKCKIDEIKLYLISKGQEDAAKKVQSFEDDLACSIQSNHDFTDKGWIVRPNPGPYDTYQRLYVEEFYDIEEMTGNYYCFFTTYSEDLAFQKLSEELQSSIKWDLSASELDRIFNEASMRYNGVLSPFFVANITEEIHFLKEAEQNAKDWVSFCTKFRHEVARSERDYMEVLIDMRKEDVAPFPSPFIKKKDNNCLLRTFKDVMKYINSATKGEYSEEELIVRYFSRDGPFASLLPDTYADYLKKKMKIAKKLGLIK